MFGMKQMGQLKINAECYTPASTIRNRGSQIDSTPIFSSTHYEQPLQNWDKNMAIILHEKIDMPTLTL